MTFRQIYPKKPRPLFCVCARFFPTTLLMVRFTQYNIVGTRVPLFFFLLSPIFCLDGQSEDGGVSMVRVCLACLRGPTCMVYGVALLPAHTQQEDSAAYIIFLLGPPYGWLAPRTKLSTAFDPFVVCHWTCSPRRPMAGEDHFRLQNMMSVCPQKQDVVDACT